MAGGSISSSDPGVAGATRNFLDFLLGWGFRRFTNNLRALEACLDSILVIVENTYLFQKLCATFSRHLEPVSHMNN